MLGYVIVGAIFLALGFAAGQAKSAGKLSAIKAELVKAEGSFSLEVGKLVASIKRHL
jgi:hypothetical protein